MFRTATLSHNVYPLPQCHYLPLLDFFAEGNGPVRATTRAHAQALNPCQNCLYRFYREAMATQAQTRRLGFVCVGRVSKANGRLKQQKSEVRCQTSGLRSLAFLPQTHADEHRQNLKTFSTGYTGFSRLFSVSRRN